MSVRIILVVFALMSGSLACAPAHEASGGATLESCSITESCGLPRICGVLGGGVRGVLGFCGEPELFGEWFCVLSALRDGVPSTTTLIAGTGECARTDEIEILGDGTAVLTRRHGGDPDLGSEWDGPTRVLVRPPNYFGPCLGSQDPLVVGQCISDWFEQDECVPSFCCPAPFGEDVPEC